MAEVNLPEGWVLACYDDVYLSASNGTGGTQNKERLGIPVSRIETIANENIDYDRIGFLATYDKDKVEKHKLVKGDILFSHINSPVHLGKTAIYDGKQNLYHGINLLRIVVDRQVILPEVFNWHCKYTRGLGEFSLRAQHAVNQSSLNQKKLGEFEIPLPPLAEQKVIAEKLDTLLAQVDNTKARIERIPEILKRFRQSVLAAAVSGKLTEEWTDGQNFSSKKGVIGDFVGVDIGHAFKSKEFTDSGVKLLRGQNIEPGSLKWLETKYFPEEKLKEYSHLFIRPGDIILAMDRPIISTGLKLARAKDQDLPCVLVQRVARFINYNGLSPDYLYLLLSDTAFTNYIQPNQTGSDIPHISGKQILSYEVKVPTIEEQTEIVRRVEELFAFADRIEQAAQAALSRVNNLTQSILAKAFRGELTADWRAANPELISGENSAEALLARIKAERAKVKPTKKAKA